MSDYGISSKECNTTELDRGLAIGAPRKKGEIQIQLEDLDSAVDTVALLVEKLTINIRPVLQNRGEDVCEDNEGGTGPVRPVTTDIGQAIRAKVERLKTIERVLRNSLERSEL